MVVQAKELWRILEISFVEVVAVSIQRELFQQLALIRKRRRAGLPFDWRTMATLAPAPEVTLALTASVPDGIRETLLSLDVQSCRRFELIFINRGIESAEEMLFDIGFSVIYLHVGQGGMSDKEIVFRFASCEGIVSVAAGVVYPKNYVSELIIKKSYGDGF